MHTFNIGSAVQGGFSAFIQKAVPLIVATLLTMVVTFGINYLFFMDFANSLTGLESSFNNMADFESRGINNVEDAISRFEGLESEEDIANEVLGMFGFNFDYNDAQNVLSDGNVSPTELLSLNSGFGGFGGFLSGLGKMVFGMLLSAAFGVLSYIVIGTITLDAVFDRKFEVSNITKNFSRIPSYIFMVILMMLAGLMNIIPIIGTIAYIVFSFSVCLAPLIILEEKMGALSAMGKSNDLMSGNRLKLLLMIIILAIVAVVVSLVTLGLGVIIISPLAACIFAHVYKQLKGAPQTVSA